MLAYSLTAWSTSHEQIQKTAETVLDKLYQTHGNTLIQKPIIKITDNETDAAVWKRRSNTIELGVKAFKVCQSFGAESNSALAFILGHELAHAFQTDAHHATSFLAHRKHPNAREALEKQADVQGVFIAHLAGFHTVKLLPEIIDRIYEAYNLKHKALYGYPSFQERKETNDEVADLTNQLLEIFESGNYLMAIGKYDLAANCFEYVEQYYQGVEVFNNLGVTYALRALNLSEKNIDPFLYPFEINWETRLRKPALVDGTKNMEPHIRREWEKYLQKAEAYFEKVTKMAPAHKAKINWMAVMILKEDYWTGPPKSQFVTWGNLSEDGALSIRLLKAIALAKRGNKNQAAAIFEELKHTSNNLIAFQAEYNLKILNGKSKLSYETACFFEEPSHLSENIMCQKDQIDTESVLLSERAQVEFSILEKSGATYLIFSQSSENLLTFKREIDTAIKSKKQKLTLPTQQLSRALQTSNAFIIPCLKEKVVYRVSKKDFKILERVYF